MIGFCVFRRYGILAPVMVLLVGCLLEFTVDRNLGQGYYASHLWTVGLDLIVSGLLVGLFVWFVAPSSSSSSGQAYQGLPKTSADVESSQVMARDEITLRDFVTVPSQTDHFCYIPLNWLALGLVGVGVLLVLADLV